MSELEEDLCLVTALNANPMLMLTEAELERYLHATRRLMERAGLDPEEMEQRTAGDV